uniref:Uncharacterized protein n=1 Tax=viral metagenome TaxID=1070528 RepID=A0A6C0EFY9_9ZZZZ
MNFKYKALLLFVILLLGLILCSFLGGNCGINHKEGFTKKTTTSSLNLNTVATYYGPNGNTAQIVKNANNTYSIVVGDCSGNDCSGNDISGNDVSGSMVDCSCNYTIYTSSSTSTSYELTVFYGTNGGVARVIRVDNGNTAIEITLPNGTIELFTITKTPYYTNQNYPKYNSWPTTNPQSYSNNYDNYNHYSGLSVSTVYYGPNGATAKVVETANSYNIIVTYPNGQTTIYTSNTNVTPNTIYVTVYYGSNGGKAVFINNGSNGQYALEVTLPNGTAILFTVNNPQTYNPDYINNTSYGTSNSYGSSNSYESSSSYVYPPASTNSTITSTVYYGPYGATARIVQTADSYYIIITYPNGQTTIYKSNTPVNSNNIYITIYYGANGGKAIFINNGTNGNYSLEVTMPNGNIILFTVTPTTSSNNNYDSSANTTNTSSNSYPYSTTNTTSNSYPYSTTNNYSSGTSGYGSSYNYSNSLPPGIPASQIPPGSEDLYILKSEVVPPVCPACPTLPCNMQSEKETCPPCPACARCPQPNFECKKVPNYDTLAEEYIPVPVLNDFSQFGM